MFVDSQFRDLLNEASPPIKKKEKNISGKFVLTARELMYAHFIFEKIQAIVKKRSDYTFLGASEGMQNHFYAWVKDQNYIVKNKQSYLNIENIIHSIWKKSNASVEQNLKAIDDKAAIADETEIRKASIQYEKDFNRAPGKLFTLRQICLLLEQASYQKSKCQH